MSQKQKIILTWAVIAFAISILLVVKNTAAIVLGAGFFAKTVAVIIGTVLGLGGAMLGDALRKFAAPDFVVTNGGMGSMLMLRLFWKMGPQSIGVLVGSAVGVSWVLS